MQKRFPALSPGLWFGITASLLLHGSLLGVKAIQRPAEAQFDTGDISVELTLIPSIASVATAKPALPEPTPPEETVEPEFEIPTPLPPETIIQEATPEPVTPEPVQPAPETAVQESLNATDQDGSPEEDKGALTQAQPTTACAPVYPRLSRRRGEEGVVVLSVEVDTAGHGSNIRIIQSSGHTRLDKAALKALANARFSPAIRFGRPIDSTLTQTFNFRLTDDQ